MTMSLADLTAPSPEFHSTLVTWCMQHPGELRLFDHARYRCEEVIFVIMYGVINHDLGGALVREGIEAGSPRFAWVFGLAVAEARFTPSGSGSVSGTTP